MIKFRYNGEAVGKGRPRYSRRGEYVHTYTPQKTKNFEEAIRFEFIAQNCEPMPVYDREVPLYAEVLIGVKIPKSYSKKRQELCRRGEIVPNRRPDIDNILKAIADALNSYAYVDDCQLAKIRAEKVYSDEPFVEVMIDELRPTE